MQTTVSKLFYRFWDFNEKGKISSEVIRITGIPHYAFALKFLLNPAAYPGEEYPVETGYGRYTKWAEEACRVHHPEVTLDHSPVNYKKNIIEWEQSNLGFSLANHPVSVNAFTFKGREYYSITDGAHRAAYFAAKHCGADVEIDLRIGREMGLPPVMEILDFMDIAAIPVLESEP
jgi:hypothetical protein